MFWKYDKEDPNDPASGWMKKAESKPKDKDAMIFTLHSKKTEGKINIMRNEIILKGIKKTTFDDFA